MKKNELNINMLGEFSISNEHHSFIPSGRSQQMMRLMAYMIANKDVDISKDKLIEILWPDENLHNPGGALRNLVYRCRSELSGFFEEEKQECIIYKNGSYSWNKAIKCKIDIFLFEQMMSLADKEPEDETRFEYLKRAHKIYKGDFLPSESTEEWVVFRSVYYRNLYTNCVLQMCRYYQSKGYYDELINLCDTSTMIDLMDERIHQEKIRAYLNKDAGQQALDYYYAISDLFSHKFGVELSDSMHEIYKEIIKQVGNCPMNIDGLVQNLKEDKKKGTFYCSFDIFKNIYLINLRSSRRSQRMRFLVLFTLEDSRYPGMSTNYLKEEMEIMHQVLSNYLRSNDVYTQSSPTQLSLILTVVNEKGRDIAVRRVKGRYEERRKHQEVVLHIDYSIIH